MEIIIGLLLVLVIAGAWFFVDARGGLGRREPPGPSGDFHPDPENTDRPAGADAEDTTVDPLRFHSGAGQEQSHEDGQSRPAEPARRRGSRGDDRPQPPAGEG